MAAAIIGAAATALSTATVGADGAPAPGVTVNVNQNATGVNVCAAGATCTQRVNVLNVTVVIVVQGAIPAPARVTLTPAAIDFGQVVSGHSSSRTAALTNRGGMPAVITGIGISGGGPAFSVGVGSCGPTGSGGVLLPGHGCALSLLFKPPTLGVQRATLRVDVDSTTLTTGLAGRGIAVAPPAPRAPVTPAAPQNNSLPLPVNLSGATPGGAAETSTAAYVSAAIEPVRHPMTSNLGAFNDPGQAVNAAGGYELDRVTATSTRARGSHATGSPRDGAGLAPLGIIVWLSFSLVAAAVTMAIGRVARAGRRQRIGLVWLD